jgi:hypothetical protein
MNTKGPSAKYLARARALAEAIDLGIDLYAALPAEEGTSLSKASLEQKAMALSPEPAFANLRSLAYLEEAFFTYWNEAGGQHIDRFWQLVAERKLPFQRKDIVREVLRRGRIDSDIEYQATSDSIVIQQQTGKILPAEADRLSNMLARFDKGRAKRRKP